MTKRPRAATIVSVPTSTQSSTAMQQALLIALVAINVFDVVLHVAIDQVEPLRIAGKAVLLLASAALLGRAGWRRSWVAFAAAAVNLALNLVFIALVGIGPLGVLLIVASTLAALAYGVLRLRRAGSI